MLVQSAPPHLPVPLPLRDFDFEVINSAEFKEDSVREEIIYPILQSLGYRPSGPNRVIRSKSLEHPFIRIGSKQRNITFIPDYLLTVANNFTLVLDAKSPAEEIKTGDNVEQVYSYAIHPEIRVAQFALCNGREFILFDVTQTEPILYFHLSELEKNWDALISHIAPEQIATQVPKRIAYKIPARRLEFDYLNIIPPQEITEFHKQAAKRHFGVHGYFTRQVWSVVQAYLKTFTQPGDLVLDPFGGSGVTAVEALMLGRKAIHVDLNPLSKFIVENLISPVDFNALGESFRRIKRHFLKNAPRSDEEINIALARLQYPKGTQLPRNSDVNVIEQLFSRQQLAQLAYLKSLLEREPEAVRPCLKLMFSGLLNKINLTYHASGDRTEGRGDGSAFRYYRYRIAPQPANLDIIKYFESRFKKVIAGKREIAGLINNSTIHNASIYRGNAANLTMIQSEGIDYIYTDPPYGAKIPYLDLSIMWNEWLDLAVTAEDYENEAIEGGEAQKSKTEYSAILSRSIQEMARVLKYDRWLSFVFAHKDPAYWHLIVNAAESAGLEYAGAVKQNNGQESFKKRQNPFTVLSGQLIINFKKVKNPKTIGKVSLGAPVMNIVMETIEAVIASNHGASLEQINNELVIRGLELGFLDVLAREYSDLTPLLTESFDYDERGQKYILKKNNRFKTHIPLEMRVRYFVISYLKRMELRNKQPTFDELILDLMPLLKNGVTPEHQTILNVLEGVAERVGTNRWRLGKAGQQELPF